ncbi:hypothetical protein HCN44_007061 [Aphidius gifuensis]|uniref:Lipocalin/cytosolic fatty-acid binding domain-containing protein n=1 Tax=Aphidius gifuensis TaxID=684658 RepID=A0A834XL65_APHGI|nr:fatty acid-binding protein-like [Aphidius gifuensis]KAF7988751.1 hypothetical protein HCN44_007061 [Aphidius gifuensis]
MVPIIGKYFYDKSEGFEKYLSKIGVSIDGEAIKHIGQSKPELEVALLDDKYTITVTNGNKTIVNSFKLGEKFTETLPIGAVLETIVSTDNEKFTFVSTLPDGNSVIREYLFTLEGITVSLSEKKFGVKATRWYKRKN